MGGEGRKPKADPKRPERSTCPSKPYDDVAVTLKIAVPPWAIVTEGR